MFKYVVDSEMGLRVEPLDLETLKTWALAIDKELENEIEAAFDQGFESFRESSEYANMQDRIEELLEDISDMQYRIKGLEK